MLLFNHTSNRWLVYITVHTTCEMRLYNDRVGDGGQRKPSAASRSARSGWRSVVDPGGDFALSRTDCLLPFLWDPDTPHYPSSLWLPTGSPPCEDKETHTHKPYIYININNQEDTMAVLSCVDMWWNEPCPSCWPTIHENNCLGEKLSWFQTSGSLPASPCRGPTPIPERYLSAAHDFTLDVSTSIRASSEENNTSPVFKTY